MTNQEIINFIKNNSTASIKELCYDLNLKIDELKSKLKSENTSLKEIRRQDENYGERLVSSLINQLKEAKDLYQQNSKAIEFHNDESWDLLHKIEDLDPQKRQTNLDFLREAITARRERRLRKNQNRLLKPLIKLINQYGLVSKLKDISGKITKRRKENEAKEYHPKVRHDLFNNSQTQVQALKEELEKNNAS